MQQITINETPVSVPVAMPSVEVRVAARREKARRDADEFGWLALLSAAARVVGDKVVARLADRARDGHSYQVKQEALRAAIGAERASRRGDVDADRHAGAAASIAQAAHERRLELYLLLVGHEANEAAQKRWQTVPAGRNGRRSRRQRATPPGPPARPATWSDRRWAASEARPGHPGPFNMLAVGGKRGFKA